MSKGIKLNFSKIGLLCLALIIALAGLGIGYAEWTETLTIAGTVNTGELLVGLRWYHAIEKDPYVEVEPRVVYWPPPGIHEHTFYLTNVYPSFGSGRLGDQQFFCAVYFARNEGTIPAKVAAIYITKPDWIEVVTYGSTVPQEIKDETIAQIQGSTDIPEEEKPAMIAAVEQDWHVGQIIYPGPPWKLHCWAFIVITLHILDTAPENGSGTVTISTVFVPWNQ